MMLSFAKYFQNLTGTKDWQTKKSRYSTKQRPAKLLKHFSKAFFSRICIANACVLFALVAVVAAAAAVAAAAVAAAAVAAAAVEKIRTNSKYWTKNLNILMKLILLMHLLMKRVKMIVAAMN